MRERGILFQPSMALATYTEIKTQTRRAVKFPHMNPLGRWEPALIGGPNGGRTAKGETIPLQAAIWHTRTGDSLMSPYGQPGDRLWVREAWQYAGWTDDGYPWVRYRAGGEKRLIERGIPEEWSERLVNIWTELSREENYEIDNTAADRRWRTSLHMPRWASRTTLEITGIRVQRLQEITADDAMAEGIVRLPDGGYAADTEGRHYHATSAWHSYASLWEFINGPGSWEANPWVWVIEFAKVPQ